jgi:hypothetical protein
MATSVPSATMDARKTRILACFTAASNVTTEQYDETIRRLEKVGDWPPEGLEYHVAFKSNGNFRVSGIWDSRKQSRTSSSSRRRTTAAAGRPKKLWEVPGASHTGGIEARPKEYKRRIVAFFDDALLAE